MNNYNPMLMFDKNLDPKQLAQLQQMQVLLGGLGQPASRVLSPSLTVPPTQPEVNKMRPILGGTSNG